MKTDLSNLIRETHLEEWKIQNTVMFNLWHALTTTDKSLVYFVQQLTLLT